MSEPRRRKGRGIDAIFDSADLDLGPTLGSAPETVRPSEREVPERDAPGPGADSTTVEATPRDAPGTYAEQERLRRDGSRDGSRFGVGERGESTAFPALDERGIPERGVPEARRPPGRPPSRRPPERELVQRGFYLEVDQDRMLDETKAALKTRGFTPDRSAIVRAAIEHFARLDRVDQEGLVRREK